MDRVTLVISGYVQGVGFRWYVQQAATTLRLAGDVRNRRDGAVVVQAEGPREALERLVELSRQGPAAAAEVAVDARWSEGPARFAGFHIGRSS
jgi:acylphosphatase